MNHHTQIKRHNRWIKTFLWAGILGMVIKGPSLYDYFTEKLEFKELKEYHSLLDETRDIDALININDHCRVYVEGLSRLYDCKSDAVPAGLYRLDSSNNGFSSFGKYKVSSEWSAFNPSTTYVLSHEHRKN